MRVSFDFDSTLTETHIQEFARDCIENDITVWVVTTRFRAPRHMVKGKFPKDHNQDLFEITDSIGIYRDNIIFMDMMEKSIFLKGKNFLFHLDDDALTVELINESKATIAIDHVQDKNWKEKCMDILWQRKVVEEEREKVLGDILSMDYDQYMDWLSYEGAGDRKSNLELARRVFTDNNFPEDYIKILDIELKKL